MRFYYRTGKHSGVSLGCAGTALLWLVLLAVIAAPVTLTAQALGLEHSPVAAVVMVVWVVLVLGWISERRSKRR